MSARYDRAYPVVSAVVVLQTAFLLYCTMFVFHASYSYCDLFLLPSSWPFVRYQGGRQADAPQLRLHPGVIASPNGHPALVGFAHIGTIYVTIQASGKMRSALPAFYRFVGTQTCATCRFVIADRIHEAWRSFDWNPDLPRDGCCFVLRDQKFPSNIVAKLNNTWHCLYWLWWQYFEGFSRRETSRGALDSPGMESPLRDSFFHRCGASIEGRSDAFN